MLASLFGIVAAMSEIIPLPVIAPILVFVGVSMISQAFSSVPEKHFPAVVIAMFPYLANYIMTRFNNAAPEAVESLSSAVVPLGQGAMFTGIIWGAMTVYIIDNNYQKATITALAASVLSTFGFIHAPSLGFMHDIQYPLGYLIVAGCFYAYSLADAKVLSTEKNKKMKPAPEVSVD